MNKKQVKHFIIGKSIGSKYGYPACHCYKNSVPSYLVAFSDEGSRSRKKVTCKNCQRTRIFRKLKGKR